MWGHIFDLQNPLVGADNTWVLWAICATAVSYTHLDVYKRQVHNKNIIFINLLIFVIFLSFC